MPDASSPQVRDHGTTGERSEEGQKRLLSEGETRNHRGEEETVRRETTISKS